MGRVKELNIAQHIILNKVQIQTDFDFGRDLVRFDRYFTGFVNLSSAKPNGNFLISNLYLSFLLG